MNALNEVNKVISSVSYYTHRHGNPEEAEWLTAERMAVRYTCRLVRKLAGLTWLQHDYSLCAVWSEVVWVWFAL